MSYISTSQNIFIMEPHMHGHHGPYLRWMAKGLAEHGDKITILTLSESVHHPSLQDVVRAFPDFISVVTVGDENQTGKYQQDSGTGLIRRELTYWRLFRKWYLQQAEKGKPDIIFLPYLDYCLYAIGLLGSPFGNTPWAGVAMRPSFHYQEMGIVAPEPSFQRLKKTLFWRLLKSRSLKYLLTIDEPLVNYLERQKIDSEKVIFMPEPCELGRKLDSGESKQRLGIEPSRKVILVYGSITPRKGVAELLRAVTKNTCLKFVTVLLGGKISNDVLLLLGEHWVQKLQRERRLVILDRYIMEKDERILFSAADIVWLGYLGHYVASGVLVQAAMAGIPVISCQDGILGWQTKRHNLGVVVHPTDVDSVVNGILSLAADDSMRFSFGANGQRAFGKNTLERSKEVLVKTVSSHATDFSL